LPPPPPPPPPPGGGGGGTGSLFPPDRFEPNETEDAALNLGTLALGAANTTSITDLNIDRTPLGLPDYDWYTWTAGSGGTFNVNVAESTGGILEVHVFTVNAQNTLIELGNNINIIAGGNATVSAALSAGQRVWVEVKGHNSSFGVVDQGAYAMMVNMT